MLFAHVCKLVIYRTCYWKPPVSVSNLPFLLYVELRDIPDNQDGLLQEIATIFAANLPVNVTLERSNALIKFLRAQDSLHRLSTASKELTSQTPAFDLLRLLGYLRAFTESRVRPRAETQGAIFHLSQ